MKYFIAKGAINPSNSDLAFKLSKEAKEKKAKGEKVIDSTLGMLLDDKGNILLSPKVKETLTSFKTVDSRGYAQVVGSDEYRNNILKWTFGDSYGEMIDKYFTSSIYTMGGTGALFVSFRNYVDYYQKVIIPSLGWNNYENIASSVNREAKTYNLFKDDKFDIDDMLSVASKSIKDCGRATVVINDPCHNPTGYTLSVDEWDKIIEGLNKLNKKGTVTLVLDIAYIDFAKDGRRFFEAILNRKAEFLTLVCFSGSKAFSLYGYRVGGLIAIHFNKAVIDEFFDSAKAVCRATWSNPNHLSMDIINVLLSDEESIKDIKKTNEAGIKLIEERLSKVRKDLGDIGKELPYKDGFFLSYEVDKATKVAEELKKKNIYVLPIKDKYIRVALCSYIKL